VSQEAYPAADSGAKVERRLPAPPVTTPRRNSD
jgi:hypothetical protein